MHWFRFAVLVLLATVLQASFFADLNSKPDLLLILLVFFAVYCDTSDAIICSFVIGFAADLIGQTMGPQMISYGIFGSHQENTSSNCCDIYHGSSGRLACLPLELSKGRAISAENICSSLWDCAVLQHRWTFFVLAICMVDAYKKTKSIRAALNPFLVKT
ncbi:MAG: rod shape-determining protein MreD [Planctomycetota bacterium]|jgi:hypothetical protein